MHTCPSPSNSPSLNPSKRLCLLFEREWFSAFPAKDKETLLKGLVTRASGQGTGAKRIARDAPFGKEFGEGP